MFTARAITSPRMISEIMRLHAHRQLGPMPERHDVGRAERGAVRQPEVEVVDEQRPPAGRRQVGVGVLHEREVGIFRDAMSACGGAAPVDLPVQERERDDRVQPNECSRREQRVGAVQFLVTAHQLGDQHDRLRCGARDEHGHQNEAERARAARLPIDSSGVGDRVCHEQCGQQRRLGPLRQQAVAVRKQQRDEDRHKQRQRRGPATLTPKVVDLLLPQGAACRAIKLRRIVPSATPVATVRS